MYKSCSRCGKIHDTRYKCNVGKIYQDTEERKLRSKYSWTKKSTEIREKANYLCEICRDQGIINYDSVEVHHIVKVRDDKSKVLDDYNLLCLCPEHHRQADAHEIDIDYMLRLAKQRESAG